jgi:hypothetical protein
MIKSKGSRKNSVLSTKEPEQKRKGSTKKRKLYPVQDEGILPIPDDYPEGIKYILNSTKNQLIGKTLP